MKFINLKEELLLMNNKEEALKKAFNLFEYSKDEKKES